MTIDDKKDLEYVDYKVKYQEAENSCLERVSPGNCFFYTLPYGSRAYEGDSGYDAFRILADLTMV